MNIKKEREAFEKLPDINAILHNSEFGFNEGINQYYHPNHTEHRLSYAFLMGAWSAWQAAKSKAVPEGFVLVPHDVAERCMGHISIAMCHPNNTNAENDVMQMDLDILESKVEAQEQSHESD